MKHRLLWTAIIGSALIGVLLIGSGSVESALDGEPPAPHGEGPSLECFKCHGPHPARDADAIELSRFRIPVHDADTGPKLTCAGCHDYPAAWDDDLSPDGCVGCHDRSGYRLAAALAELTAQGHPDVLRSMLRVPENCLMCHHGELALGPPLHRLHVASETYATHFGATGCRRCHVVDAEGKTGFASQRIDR